MAKHNDGLFRQVVMGGLRRERSNGIAQGSYAMCKVVLDLAQKEDKTAEERLKSIIDFCAVCIDPDKLKAALDAPQEDTDNEV